MDKENEILIWTAGISQAAANMLNRGGDKEKIELRKFVNQWMEDIEPHYDAINKGLATKFDLQFFYLELRGWEFKPPDEWLDSETGEYYFSSDAMQIQIIRDDSAKRPRPGVSEMEAMHMGGKKG